MKKKIRIVAAVAATLIGIAGIAYAASYYSISQLQGEVDNLQRTVEVDNEEMTKMSNAKNSIHTAAEDLRGLRIASNETIDSAINQLSQSWAKIDSEQNWLRSEIEKNSKLLEEKKAELDKLEKERGRFLGVFETTAYWWGEDSSTTSTGVTPRVGRTLAVDPRVIPYGTVVHLYNHYTGEDLGTRVAEDCGGAIKGNRLDLFLSTDAECRAWGRRQLDVYIAE